MAKRKIVWTKTATAQRRHVLEYWARHNQSTTYSEKLIVLIRKRTQDLLEHPKLGKKVDFPKTRVISLGHISIFYTTDKDQIIITGFWDNRQDPSKLFKVLSKST